MCFLKVSFTLWLTLARLPFGQTIHEPLVLSNQLSDDFQVVRKRFLLQHCEVLLFPYQPLHQLVQEAKELKQLLEMLLQLLHSLQCPGLHIVPSRLNDCYPVLDYLHSIRKALLQDFFC